MSPFPQSRILPGAPAIVVNGKRLAAVAYASYLPDEKYLAAFASCGYRLYSVACTLGDRGVNSDSGIRPFRQSMWLAPGCCDFTPVEADLALVLRACPDAFILLRVNLDVPTWWGELHPHELTRLANNQATRQSMASTLWRQEAGEVLRRLLSYLSDSPCAKHIVGIMVAAGQTEEWFHHGFSNNRFPDYSLPMQNAWKAWQMEQHPDQAIAPLPAPNERVGQPDLMLRSWPDEANVIGYYQLHSRVVAESILHFCKIVKQASAGNLLAGAFYGYIFEVGANDAGHHAAHLVLTSAVCDFLASPNSYALGRPTGVDWAYFSATASVQLHDKLWLSESDTRTDLTRPLREKAPQLPPPGTYEGGIWAGPTERTVTLDNLKANAARAITHNCGLWWFDMWGGWYHADDIMQLMAQAQAAYNRYINTPGLSVAEVAVFVDEISCNHTSSNTALWLESLYLQRLDLGFMGTPYDVYYLHDLAQENIPPSTLSRYKLVLFLNIFRIDVQTRKAINALKCCNRVLCWFVAPGYFGGEDDNHDITGMRLRYKINKASAPLLVQIAENAHPLVKGLDAVTYGIERSVYRDVVVVDDISAVPLGYLTGPQSVSCGLAVKEHGTWTGVFSGAPHWPWTLLHNACHYAGVHVYTNGGFLLYANSRVLAIHAPKTGNYTIHLPRAASLTDLFTGEAVGPSLHCRNLALPKGMHVWQISAQ